MSNPLQDFFSKIPLFASLTAEELGEFLRAVQPLALTQGELLFKAGEPGDAAYVIQEGEVEVTSRGGRPIATLGPGQVIGELSLLDGAPRSATIRASTPTQLFRIDKQEFDYQRRNLRTPAYKIMRTMAMTLSGRIRETNAQIGELLAPAPHTPPADAAKDGGGFFKKVFGWIGG
ncbi:MAG: cyclic nucleotide-binding domain-containing protein [Myxococcales bacterium]|nr:cyclic nucleotide-binding domain-containing protein [Myxococcales bacterium]MCB9523651.1 cyclic nucleotide-binding domain-containing protein [Myxococcales bacterium]